MSNTDTTVYLNNDGWHIRFNLVGTEFALLVGPFAESSEAYAFADSKKVELVKIRLESK